MKGFVKGRAENISPPARFFCAIFLLDTDGVMMYSGAVIREMPPDLT
jgi:hypothetical protein